MGGGGGGFFFFWEGGGGAILAIRNFHGSFFHGYGPGQVYIATRAEIYLSS